MGQARYPYGSKYLIIRYLPKTCTIIPITQNPSTKLSLYPKPYVPLYIPFEGNLIIGYLDPLGTYTWDPHFEYRGTAETPSWHEGFRFGFRVYVHLFRVLGRKVGIWTAKPKSLPD